MPDVTSLGKTNLIPKFGPGRAGFAVKRSDQRIWSDIDGTQRPVNTDGTITLTTTRTLLAKESGSKVMLNSATAFTTTLPKAAKGLEFRFFVQIAASATGHTIATGTGPIMYGKVSPGGAASAATASKGRTNTQATSTVGDSLHVWSDGTNWFSVPGGTWAEQA